jgi:CRP/FNR family transcriptional regulator, anaerobic regulatory protein
MSTIKNIFPELTENELELQILEKGKVAHFGKDEILVETGSYIKSIPLLISGCVKVIRENDEGQELFLYYYKEGESCAMTLKSCLLNEKSKIRAITDEPTEVILIPSNLVEEWIKQYPSWKNFIIHSISQYFDNLLLTIDAIAFQKIDEKLLSFLRNRHKASQNHELNITQLQIAHELNSSREVISRLLKQLEKQGKIKLYRNKIEIINLL